MTNHLKYNSTINRLNKNNSHTLALDFVLSGANRPLTILEVGCSAGYFGAHLKALGHHVCGVEMDTESAKVASETLDEVYCDTVQNFFANNPQRQFDVITFGDVIEHLHDPKEILLLSKKHLLPDGKIVCSVPNVAHISIRAMLLQGDWKYATLGILDRTHLRFFTKHSLIELFDDVGLCINQIQAVRLTAAQAATMCGLEIKESTLKLIDDIPRDDCIEDFQYVISSTVKSPSISHHSELNSSNRSLRILALSDQTGSNISKIRLETPLTEFANENCRLLRVKSFYQVNRDDIAWADICVIQRGACSQAYMATQICQDLGKPYIYEIDDLLIDIPEFLSHHEGYIKNRKKIEYMLRKASAVTVSTERLKTALTKYNSTIWVCPNYHSEYLSVSASKSEQASELISLIIASSDKIYLDFLIPAILHIQSQYKESIQIIAIGPIANTLTKAGVACISHDVLPYEKFVEFVSQFNNPIGLIPLDDSTFSACKSSIKFLDYSVAGAVSVCSNVPPYSDSLIDKVTGRLVDNTEAAWVDAIEQLIKNSELREHLAANAKKYVSRQHSLITVSTAWRQVFMHLAPNDTAIQLQPKRSLIGSSIRKLHAFLRAKNQQRKINRRTAKKQSNRIR